MSYQLQLLQDGERTLRWNKAGDYDTLREAMMVGERRVKDYQAFMYTVFNNDTKKMVWESARPVELKAHY